MIFCSFESCDPLLCLMLVAKNTIVGIRVKPFTGGVLLGMLPGVFVGALLLLLLPLLPSRCGELLSILVGLRAAHTFCGYQPQMKMYLLLLLVVRQEDQVEVSGLVVVRKDYWPTKRKSPSLDSTFTP